MTVVREYAINELLLKDQFSTANESAVVSRSLPSNMLLQGATMRTSTGFGRTATVKAGEDIRPALESLKSAGGGTLVLLAGVHRLSYDLIGVSKINIVGEGIDQTILDFGNESYQINFIGTISNILKNFSVSNLTIKDSTDPLGGLYANLADDFSISNVKVYSCAGYGLYLRDVQNGVVDGCVFDSNTGHNFFMYGSDTRLAIAPDYESCVNILISNCRAINGGACGFYFEVYSVGAAIKYINVNNCLSRDNTASGFYLTGSSPYEAYSSFSGCTADTNGGYGFFSYLGRLTFFACHAVQNTLTGFEIGVLNSPSILIGSHASLNTPEIDINENTLVIGNVIPFGSLYDSVGAITEQDTKNTLIGMMVNASIVSSKQIVRAKNTSGASLAIGDVVVLKPVAGGLEVTTTTTVGDKNVFGMSLGTPSNNNWGSFLVFGKTALLKVDGTTDIAIGDYLTTFSTAKIAQKATTTGQMVFAVALEAYTNNDSNGVIDAYLLPYHFPLP